MHKFVIIICYHITWKRKNISKENYRENILEREHERMKDLHQLVISLTLYNKFYIYSKLLIIITSQNVELFSESTCLPANFLIRSLRERQR